MKLWIRSQDKKQLLKVNDGLFIANFYDITFIGIKNVDYVGIYTIEERALEVLNEIQDLIRSISDSDLKIVIYEMPEE